MTDADGHSANAPNVSIPYDESNGGSGGYWSAAADVPTVTIEQCDANKTPTTTPVQPGSNAYFRVELGGNLSNHVPTITVPYYTEDGNPAEGLPDGVAYANVDYSNKVGTLTFTYDSSLNGGTGGYAPQMITVPTIGTSGGGDFTAVVPDVVDPAAALPGPTPCSAEASAAVAGPDIKLEVVDSQQGPLAEYKNGVVSNNANNPSSVPIGQQASRLGSLRRRALGTIGRIRIIRRT